MVRPEIPRRPPRSPKETPLIRGLVLTNRCNLHCRHCNVATRGPKDLDFAEVTAAVDAFYREGGRCLYLEGGEPFLWHDGPRRLDDIVDYAHGLGYLTVVVYTNGTLPLRTSADTVFVSVDGLRATHDALRGTSFDRIMRNIQESAHPSLFINYTINSRNKDEIRAFCDHVEGMRQHPRRLLLPPHALLRPRRARARLRRAAARPERAPVSARELPDPQFPRGTASRR